MANAPSVPAVDKRLLSSPGLEGYHAALSSFFQDTAAALSHGLTLRDNAAALVRGPSTVKVPEDWVQVSLDTNWLNFGGSEREFEYRKTLDGIVKTRGSFKWTGGSAPAAGTRISPLSSALVTGKQETMVILTQSPPGVGHVTISPTGLFYQSGATAALSSTGLEWTASSRTPPAWGAPFPLFYEWDKLPALVWVDAAQVDTSGKPTGLHLSCAAEWRQGEKGGKSGFYVTRLPGLTVGASYSVTLYALAG
jgi:hypothetical protein